MDYLIEIYGFQVYEANSKSRKSRCLSYLRLRCKKFNPNIGENGRPNVLRLKRRQTASSDEQLPKISSWIRG